MKSFKTYISEAVATRKKPTAKARKDFKEKFSKVISSDAFYDEKQKRYFTPWHVTGHNAGSEHGSTESIEAMKEKVFGKRRKGKSDLLFMHHEHGIITHPASGDTTHLDVTDMAFDHRKPTRKGVKVDPKIAGKIRSGGHGAINGLGRIEHHEDGGGIVSYHHYYGNKAGAIRTIARAYPKYKIHDGHGNLLEGHSMKSFKTYLNEAKEETITDFVRFASRKLGLQQEPNIEFVDVRDGSMTTAAYSPSDRSMRIYRGNRATFDICRSIAHEMVHQMQDENGDELDGTTGSPCEDEANAVAGRLIRMYGAENDAFYEE